jgi:spore photoproduct lyase
MKLASEKILVQHHLVRQVYAIHGRTEFSAAERIKENCEKLGIPFVWVKEVPRSCSTTLGKLEEERGILLLIDRKSPFIERFKHPKGLCYPFYKLSAHNSCNFWCEYCYLYQTFFMRPQSIHYVNYDKMFKEIDDFSKSIVHPKFQVLNLGELGDPLATDDLTGFSRIIIPYVANKEKVKVLFLTKSTQVGNLLGLEHNNRTILSWSLNCDLIAEKLEHRAPPPLERIKSAAKAQQAGYEIRFRIDPLFWFDGWQEHYAKLVEEMARYTSPTLITMGTYRPSKGLVNHIRARFPRSNLIRLEEKLMLDAGKKRFPDNKRIEIYRYLAVLIKERMREVTLALCKEPHKIWRGAGLDSRAMTCNCTDFVID